MLNAPIQSFFIQPRQGKDPRVAKTDGTSLAVGSDGKLYKMAERNDWEKYRTLSDAEMRDELSKSVEIKENMYMLNGKLSKGKYLHGSRSSGIKLVAPQFGTQSHSRKKELRQWEQDLQHMTSGGSPGATTSQYHDTMATLARNQISADTLKHGSAITREDTTYSFRAADGGEGVAQSSEDRIHAAVSTMKQKYEQNLHVVEQLFDEKKYMERKIQLLERRLQQQVREEATAEDGDFDGADPLAHATYAERPPPYDELSDNGEGPRPLLRSSYEPALRASRGRHEEYSAAELAALMEPTGRGRGEAAPRPRSAPTRRDPRRTSSERAGTGDREPRGGGTLRSSSASGRRSVTACSVSANLQADADRYIQKRRMLEEQERLKRLEDERYEHQLKERYLRASMNGKEFTEMRRRQEVADQQAKARLEKFQQKQAELEEAARNERRAKLEANKASLAMVTKNQLSWRELQEIEEAKRRDRIERRKQELAQVSALPSSIAENLQKSKREAAVGPSPGTSAGFKAEDPAKVAAKLARAQKVWELKMERERERIKEKSGRLAVTGGSGSAGSISKTAMEVRTEQYAAKREAKAREREERERAEAQRLKEEEDKRREKLLNTKVPVGKPTNSAIMKAEKVRNDRLKEQEDERRMRAQMRKKEISEKEASAVLRTIVAEREIERHGGSGGHFELRSSGLAEAQRKAAEVAAAAREEYRNQLRANKKRIQDSLQNRQSLMERHDKALAMKTVTQEALQKVAGAVGLDAGVARKGASGKGQSGGGGADNLDHLDLFDAKEQVRLGLKTL